MEARVGWIVALTSPAVKPFLICTKMMVMMVYHVDGDNDDQDDGGGDYQQSAC